MSEIILAFVGILLAVLTYFLPSYFTKSVKTTKDSDKPLNTLKPLKPLKTISSVGEFENLKDNANKRKHVLDTI